MHAAAAERLVVGLLAGRHLHQWRAAEEDLRAALDHHDVVTQPRHVGTARRGVAEDQGDRRDPGGRQPGQVAEDLAARNEDLLLGGQIGAAGFDQVDQRQPVAQRDLTSAQRFAQRPRVGGPAADRRVARGQHAFGALDDPDAGHHAAADSEAGAPGGQRRQLKEWRVRVDEQLDPFPRGQLATAAVPLGVVRPAARHRLRVLGVKLREPREHRRAPGRVLRSANVQGTAENSHMPNDIRPALRPARGRPGPWRISARRV